MLNNIFKALYLLAFICLIGVLYGIYTKMDNGRFQMSKSASGFISVLDTNNGKVYHLSDNDEYFIYNRSGNEIYISPKKNKNNIQSLPK